MGYVESFNQIENYFNKYGFIYNQQVMGAYELIKEISSKHIIITLMVQNKPSNKWSWNYRIYFNDKFYKDYGHYADIEYSYNSELRDVLNIIITGLKDLFDIDDI